MQKLIQIEGHRSAYVLYSSHNYYGMQGLPSMLQLVGWIENFRDFFTQQQGKGVQQFDEIGGESSPCYMPLCHSGKEGGGAALAGWQCGWAARFAYAHSVCLVACVVAAPLWNPPPAKASRPVLASTTLSSAPKQPFWHIHASVPSGLPL